MRYYYTYEIKIINPTSSLNGMYYYGKHITSNLNDNYYGSGKILLSYKKKYGTQGLQKNILNFYQSEAQLNSAEYELIKRKQKELKDKCLNLNEGGHGSFSYINSTNTPEIRHSNAMAGGLGNQKRLKNPIEAEQWRQTVINIHASRTPEEKEAIYNKVSNSLKEYYRTNEGQKELEVRNKKNKQSNIAKAKQWREEFKTLFKGKSPEAFRKYGKQKESCDLYKEIKELPKEIQQIKIEQFFKSIEEIV